MKIRSRLTKRGFTSGAIAFLTISALSFSSIPAASADEQDIDISDSLKVISKIAPDLLEQTANAEESVSTIKQPDSDSGAKINLDAESVQATDPALDARNGELAVSPSISIEPLYIEDQVSADSNISVWATDSPNVAAYIQPLDTGVRVYTAISESSAPSSYDYKLDVPEGTTLRENGLGYMIIGPEGGSLGQLLAPWAKDSNGKELPTSFKWNEGVLTQDVDLSDPSISYPVLMDPAWSYTYTHGIESRTPSEIRSLLMDCFNCYFPVAGASQQFPSYKQFLPLTVVAWNFNCTMDTTYFETSGNKSWFGYRFLATKDHVDGLGSSIGFDFNPKWTVAAPNVIRTQMVVSAYIVNDNPTGVGRPLYQAGASANWAGFAANLDFS